MDKSDNNEEGSFPEKPSPNAGAQNDKKDSQKENMRYYN